MIYKNIEDLYICIIYIHVYIFIFFYFQLLMETYAIQQDLWDRIIVQRCNFVILLLLNFYTIKSLLIFAKHNEDYYLKLQKNLINQLMTF